MNSSNRFIDFAPTFVELAGLKWSETGMHSSPGCSLTDIFLSEKPGIVSPRMFGRGYIFDKYPYADDSGRDFYERYISTEFAVATWDPYDPANSHLGKGLCDVRAVYWHNGTVLKWLAPA